MADLERAIIEETGDYGYFKDIVARKDVEEVKKMINELNDMQELTDNEVSTIYNRVYKEIFG